jgi:hypothetical protein
MLTDRGSVGKIRLAIFAACNRSSGNRGALRVFGQDPCTGQCHYNRLQSPVTIRFSEQLVGLLLGNAMLCVNSEGHPG